MAKEQILDPFWLAAGTLVTPHPQTFKRQALTTFQRTGKLPDSRCKTTNSWPIPAARPSAPPGVGSYEGLSLRTRGCEAAVSAPNM